MAYGSRGIMVGKAWYGGSSRKLRDHISVKSRKQRRSRKGEQEVESTEKDRKYSEAITPQKPSPVMCFHQQVSTP